MERVFRYNYWLYSNGLRISFAGTNISFFSFIKTLKNLCTLRATLYYRCFCCTKTLSDLLQSCDEFPLFFLHLSDFSQVSFFASVIVHFDRNFPTFSRIRAHTTLSSCTIFIAYTITHHTTVTTGRVDYLNGKRKSYTVMTRCYGE